MSVADCAALVATAPWLVLGGLVTDFAVRSPCRSLQDRYQPRARTAALKYHAVPSNEHVETTTLHNGLFTLWDDQARWYAARERFTGGALTAISLDVSMVRDANFIWSLWGVFARYFPPP